MRKLAQREVAFRMVILMQGRARRRICYACIIFPSHTNVASNFCQFAREGFAENKDIFFQTRVHVQ